MEGYISKVKDFVKAYDGSIPNRPLLMDDKAKSFIRTMVNDELDELDEAVTLDEEGDALLDAIYYLCSHAVKHGHNLDKLFPIVHSANMAKIVDGKVIRRKSDGKVIKPEGWVDPKPLLVAEINRQNVEGSWS
jgi:predicted HAD superfamily Cof-like phosphohydrolase